MGHKGPLAHAGADRRPGLYGAKRESPALSKPFVTALALEVEYEWPQGTSQVGTHSIPFQRAPNQTVRPLTQG
jgi:hypothetical protein